MKKAVFFDLDGTLLPARTKVLPPDTVDALFRLQENDIAVVLCTGRTMHELEYLKALSFPFDGYIILNGQMCLDEALQPYHEQSIAGEELETLIRLFDSMTVPVTIAEKARLYINYINDVLTDTLASVSTKAPELGRYQGDPVFLGTVYCDRDTQATLDLGTLIPARWHDKSFDLYPASSGKDAGIRAFMARYGIAREDTVAFGDSENDLSMIRYAGIGVAMGNAMDTVKHSADLVTDACDCGGIAKALVRLGLIDA